MKLKNLSESFVKEFAGATIFGRGNEYCRGDMVGEIGYDSVRDHIQAEVSGSSVSSYDVEITAAKRGIDARGSCPLSNLSVTSPEIRLSKIDNSCANGQRPYNWEGQIERGYSSPHTSATPVFLCCKYL